MNTVISVPKKGIQQGCGQLHTLLRERTALKPRRWTNIKIMAL